MQTRLTELLEIEHPVMLAGMGGVSYHRLAAAVSEAGGFGCLGASTMSPSELRDEMAKVRRSTAKGLDVSSLTLAISSRSSDGLIVEAPRQPNPPASDTAAARRL